MVKPQKPQKPHIHKSHSSQATKATKPCWKTKKKAPPSKCLGSFVTEDFLTVLCGPYLHRALKALMLLFHSQAFLVTACKEFQLRFCSPPPQ